MDIFGYKIQSPFVSNRFQDLTTKTVVDRNSINISPTFDEEGNPFYPAGYSGRVLSGGIGGVSWTNMDDLSKIYHSNVIINAALNVNARYLANVEVRVRDLGTGIIYSKGDIKRGKLKNRIVDKMFALINEPNPLQSTDEFLKFLSITHDTHGNSMIRGNFAFNRIDIETISTMFCLWPQYAKPIMTKRYWDAVDIKGIIDHWEYDMFGTSKQFSTDEILHRKEANITINSNEDLVLGKSRLLSLKQVISTLDASYESRNVIANERGAKTIISPKKNDPFMGSLPLTTKERDSLEKTLQKKYGLKFNQHQNYLSDIPLEVFQYDQDIRKLGIVEEIGLDAMAVAHIYDIPPELIKMYKEGATYENQASNERIMYQSNAMVRAESIFNDLNNWLSVRKHGFEYITSWDHIAVLQDNKKEKSLIERNTSFVCREAFLAGACTLNEWRVKQGWEQINEPFYNLRITEMTPEEVQTITGRTQILAQNENKPEPDSSSQI